jgi:Flp pilus assembly protein TadD
VAEARAGRRDSARVAFRRGLDLEPGDAAAHLNLGLLAELDGDLAAAERELEAAAAAGAADHIERLLALGRIAVKRGDAAAAGRFYRRAAEVAPDDPRVRASAGELEPGSGR